MSYCYSIIYIITKLGGNTFLINFQGEPGEPGEPGHPGEKGANAFISESHVKVLKGEPGLRGEPGR